MDWIYIGFIPPFLWALTNFIDKYIVDKYVDSEKGDDFSILIFSYSIVSFFVILVLFFFLGKSILDISLLDVVIMILAGVVYLIGFIFYWKSLSISDVFTTTPIYQTIPVFSLILGYIFLGERLDSTQILGFLIVIIGAVFLVFDSRKFHFNLRILTLMLIASFLPAMSVFLFKYISVDVDFFTLIFYENIGFILVGIYYLIFPSNREKFKSLFGRNFLLLKLDFFNSTLDILAKVILNYISLLTLLSYVWLVEGFQSFFVLFIGVILTMFYPKIFKEDISKKNILYKLSLFIFMIIGLSLL